MQPPSPGIQMQVHPVQQPDQMVPMVPQNAAAVMMEPQPQ